MVWLTLLLACSGGADSAAEPGACAAQPLDACEETPGCAAIYGTALIDDGAGGLCAPADGREVLACTDAGQTCPAVELVGAPPGAADACHQIPAGCMPDGWSTCADIEVVETCP
jgi:hypothetical protein